MQKIFLYFVITISVLLSACGGSSSSQAQADGDTLRLQYARQLTIVRYPKYIVATVADPWHEGKTLHRYVLVADSIDINNVNLPEGTVVRTPVNRLVVFTTVHSSLLLTLGAGEAIKGVCDLRYIDIPWIQKQCQQGKIKNCGSGMAPDIEKIIETKPGAILISPFENSGGYGKLEEVNIPLVECADYMESTPLGRAEWMRFFGLLTGHEQQADSLFNVVEARYNALRDKAQHTTSRPSVVMDKKNGSVWYVPGGESTLGRMIDDAGGAYAFASEKKGGSLSLPFESVLARAGQSDVWLFRYSAPNPITSSQLISEYEGYHQMKALQTHRAYGCNTMTSLFYEESPFRPDYLLNDIITILHPELTGLESCRYFKPLTY